jgi:hypothetical protein
MGPGQLHRNLLVAPKAPGNWLTGPSAGGMTGGQGLHETCTLDVRAAASSYAVGMSCALSGDLARELELHLGGGRMLC